MKPLICVPMGDPAGIGPEILAAVAANPDIYKTARLLGICDGRVFKRAAQAMHGAPTIQETSGSLSDIRENAFNFIDLANADPTTFETGKPGPVNGKAAYEYVAYATKLALAGKVDALATTCLNKEAMHMAHVPYIGHTEILAELTGIKNPLTMFQVRSLRVFFLTRHLSLRKACDAVTKETLLPFIFRCHESNSELPSRVFLLRVLIPIVRTTGFSVPKNTRQSHRPFLRLSRPDTMSAGLSRPIRSFTWLLRKTPVTP